MYNFSNPSHSEDYDYRTTSPDHIGNARGRANGLGDSDGLSKGTRTGSNPSHGSEGHNPNRPI